MAQKSRLDIENGVDPATLGDPIEKCLLYVSVPSSSAGVGEATVGSLCLFF